MPPKGIHIPGIWVESGEGLFPLPYDKEAREFAIRSGWGHLVAEPIPEGARILAEDEVVREKNIHGDEWIKQLENRQRF